MALTKAASLADDLVRLFAMQIENGTLAPGARFPTEKTITLDYAVSRTVVREAFARLAARGLLQSRRGSGAYVADNARYQAFQVTPDELGAIEDVLRLLEMRVGFETEMSSLAAERRTDADLTAMRAALDAMEDSHDMTESVAADAAFHAAIARASKNDYFQRFTDFLGVRLVPSRRLYLQTDDPAAHRAYARTINRDHQAIYRAIEAQDPARARSAARRHMQKSFERYQALRERMPG
ncbi:FadR family transcriptional regulator [Sphingomonas ginsenosidivorax]|uniref:FadR family transcriptional regulator n=1 Tax=Sphingomonas ginsenosidivorax TaxID=862135 RepID=A0A5C6UC31_9SPHN|nr:FCD domain-containing protein [Sphingomonas ginsenosidivorax]TXC69666.1 FadR family transcriptional regulator [Sphingomonas ginsenosidivorax]